MGPLLKSAIADNDTAMGEISRLPGPVAIATLPIADRRGARNRVKEVEDEGNASFEACVERSGVLDSGDATAVATGDGNQCL